jgi:hypothetical protein
MAIAREELKRLLREPSADIEKKTTLSSDGRNLLTRIPREIVEFLKLKRGDKLRWSVNPETKEISVKILKNG